MAKIKSTENVLKELKKNIEKKKVVLGTQRTIKLMKEGKIAKVISSKNCPLIVKDDIIYYTKISGIELIELDVPNEELGVLCKKPFSISIVGVLK